jgi:hypothetical protein
LTCAKALAHAIPIDATIVASLLNRFTYTP